MTDVRYQTTDGIQHPYRYSLIYLCLAVTTTAFAEETTAERLLAQYEQINTMSCDVRKETQNKDGKSLSLSHIYFKRPNRIHVHNATPTERRIIADGTNLYYYVQGDPGGFSSPITNLNESWLLQLRRVPGTATDHLIRLKGIPEIKLEPTPGFPIRAGYQLEKVFAVLSLIDSNRLAQVTFYSSREMKNLLAEHSYSQFEEVINGVSISRLHRIKSLLAGMETIETSRISNISINKPVSNELFQTNSYIKAVSFVPLFDKNLP